MPDDLNQLCEELRGLLEKAVEGPLHVEEDVGEFALCTRGGFTVARLPGKGPTTEYTAQAMVALFNGTPRLLSAITDLARQNQGMREALRKIASVETRPQDAHATPGRFLVACRDTARAALTAPPARAGAAEAGQATSPESTGDGVFAEVAKLPADEQEGLRRYLAGERLGASSGIDDSYTLGYGELDQHGFWQYPLPRRMVVEENRQLEHTRKQRKRCDTAIDSIRKALHDAINSPKGVVPDSALPFYDASLVRDGATVTRESSDTACAFNINSDVWVRLTPRGHKMYADWWRDLVPEKPVPEIRQDEGGWSRWQLWELMNIFGPSTQMGDDLPFETVIRLDRSIYQDRVIATCPRCGKIVEEQARAQRGDGAGGGKVGLHAAIMNIPTPTNVVLPHHPPDVHNAYYLGFRDARHAAADLVSAQREEQR